MPRTPTFSNFLDRDKVAKRVKTHADLPMTPHFTIILYERVTRTDLEYGEPHATHYDVFEHWVFEDLNAWERAVLDLEDFNQNRDSFKAKIDYSAFRVSAVAALKRSISIDLRGE